jgi:hypothetical protein
MQQRYCFENIRTSVLFILSMYIPEGRLATSTCTLRALGCLLKVNCPRTLLTVIDSIMSGLEIVIVSVAGFGYNLIELSNRSASAGKFA